MKRLTCILIVFIWVIFIFSNCEDSKEIEYSVINSPASFAANIVADEYILGKGSSTYLRIFSTGVDDSALSYSFEIKSGVGEFSNGEQQIEKTDNIEMFIAGQDIGFVEIEVIIKKNGSLLDSEVINIFINGEWSYAGGPGFTSNEASFIKPAIAPDGSLYVVYMDNGSSGNYYNGRMSKLPDAYDSDYSFSWEDTLVALTGGFSRFNHPSIAISNDNIPFVAYYNYVYGSIAETKGILKKYVIDTWEQVGEDICKKLYYPSTFFDSNNDPIVVYYDLLLDRGCAKIYHDSTWDSIGSESFTDGDVGYITAKLGNDDNIFAAYYDKTASDKITVKQYDGVSWDNVGTKGFVEAVSSFSLAVDSNNIPYIAYKTSTNNISVIKYNGATWDYVGDEIAEDNATMPNLVLDNDDTPIIIYQDGDHAGRVSANIFVNNQWLNLGDVAFSPGMAECIEAIYDKNNNIVYVTFRDNTNNSSITAMKFQL